VPNTPKKTTNKQKTQILLEAQKKNYNKEQIE
jgi:hypothetical protein